MRGTVQLMIIGAALLSCADNHPPEGVLPKEQMVFVLQEIYIAEEKVNRLSLRSDSTKAVFRELEPRLFRKLGISDSSFRQSMRYYMEHPKEWEQIYATVIDSLNLREQRLSLPEDAPGGEL